VRGFERERVAHWFDPVRDKNKPNTIYPGCGGSVGRFVLSLLLVALLVVAMVIAYSYWWMSHRKTLSPGPWLTCSAAVAMQRQANAAPPRAWLHAFPESRLTSTDPSRHLHGLSAL
jgi:hypothetical protein